MDKFNIGSMQMHKQIFISGIDTDCGKTYITGLIARNLRRAGINCITSKLVQTGCSGIADDILEHRRIMETDLFSEDKDGITCPFVYSFPASPHLAASIDNRPFDLAKVKTAFQLLEQSYDVVLTEGAGGLCVPLSEEVMATDYLKENQLPLLLVSSSHLGSINHTLISIDYCMNNNINLLAVVYNQFPSDDPKISSSSYHFLQNYIAGNFPQIKLIHGNDLTDQSAENVTGMIFAMLK